jgi:thiol-disulfide isomerase/thioredoxin
LSNRFVRKYRIPHQHARAGALLAGLLLCLQAASGASADAVSLEHYRGSVVLLDFWASWCVPCRRSFPWMNEMHGKYADDGLVIVAVNLDNDPAEARAFLREFPSDFRIGYDEEKSLARRFEVQAMPSSYLIGRDGQVLKRHFGFKAKKTSEYEAAIKEALIND